MRKKYIRVGFTAAQSSELWDRWQKGEGLKSIGRWKTHPFESVRTRCICRYGRIGTERISRE
jgi:hypothetical protein